MTSSSQIQQILQHKGGNVWSVSPETKVFDAISLMAEKNVGALLVTGPGGKLIGILSERDYTRKVILKGRNSRDTAVRDILSDQLISVTPEHSVGDCLRLMTQHRIRHLPVLKGDTLAGVVSIGDLVNWIISEQQSAIHQLETYITGYPTPSA
jgi:CBS domain-containing protein